MARKHQELDSDGRPAGGLGRYAPRRYHAGSEAR